MEAPENPANSLVVIQFHDLPVTRRVSEASINILAYAF
jgi:hypothetical protein